MAGNERFSSPGDPDPSLFQTRVSGYENFYGTQSLGETPSVLPGREIQDWEAAVPTTLIEQYRYHIDLRRQYNDILRPELRRPENDFNYLDAFYQDFFRDRITRAHEVKSDRYREVVNIARQVLPMPTYLISCVDGRDLPSLRGLTADTAGTYRVAGGDPSGFSRNSAGTLDLDPQSDLAQEVKQALQKSPNGSITEIFSVHTTCAADGLKQKKIGHAADGGVLSSVIRKVEMTDATKRMVAQSETHKDNHLVLVQEIFNPDNGHMYLGVERQEALDYGRENGGYTVTNLDNMAKQNLIISTQALATSDEVVSKVFADHKFPVNWMSPHYVESAEQYWNNVVGMEGRLLPHLKEKVSELYPPPEMPEIAHRRSPEGIDALRQYLWDLDQYNLEIDEKATLVLLNAYTGFLNNLPKENGELTLVADQAESEVETPTVRDDTEHAHGNPFYIFGDHEEEGIKASVGTHPPYRKKMFAAFVKDRRLASNIEIAHGIVRDNRSMGRVKDTDGLFESVEDFVNAPVPLIVKEVVRKEKPMSDSEWKQFQDLDLKDLPLLTLPPTQEGKAQRHWDKWKSAEFIMYLSSKGVSLPEGVRKVIQVKEESRTGEMTEHHRTEMQRDLDSFMQKHYEVRIPTDVLLAITQANEWEDEEFFEALDKIGIALPPVVKGMDNLRKYMKQLYEDEETSDHLISSSLAALPVLSDGTREPRMVLPFILLGKNAA